MVTEHERSSNSFGIENFYNPEALYSLLSKDHLAHSYPLQTDWPKIIVPEYDPVINVTGTVGCDLKVKYTGTGSRLDKVYWFYSDIEIPNRLYLTDELKKEMNNLSKFGLNVSLKKKFDIFDLFTQENMDLSHQFHNYDYYTSVVDNSQTLAISYIPPLDSHYKIRVVLPWVYGELNNLDNFANTQKGLLQNTEKVIKSIFDLENKDLPPVKLQFKAEQEKSQEFVAECSYCGSNYFTAQGLTCPKCGGSEPHFLQKEEI